MVSFQGSSPFSASLRSAHHAVTLSQRRTLCCTLAVCRRLTTAISVPFPAVCCRVSRQLACPHLDVGRWSVGHRRGTSLQTLNLDSCDVSANYYPFVYSFGKQLQPAKSLLQISLMVMVHQGVFGFQPTRCCRNAASRVSLRFHSEMRETQMLAGSRVFPLPGSAAARHQVNDRDKSHGGALIPHSNFDLDLDRPATDFPFLTSPVFSPKPGLIFLPRVYSASPHPNADINCFFSDLQLLLPESSSSSSSTAASFFPSHQSSSASSDFSQRLHTCPRSFFSPAQRSVYKLDRSAVPIIASQAGISSSSPSHFRLPAHFHFSPRLLSFHFLSHFQFSFAHFHFPFFLCPFSLPLPCLLLFILPLAFSRPLLNFSLEPTGSSSPNSICFPHPLPELAATASTVMLSRQQLIHRTPTSSFRPPSPRLVLPTLLPGLPHGPSLTAFSSTIKPERNMRQLASTSLTLVLSSLIYLVLS